ncbi:MAG: hypothetical protein R3322_00135 [Kiloniellales bacterium]|nr:hypothetical protein [Kiloniellales bacterium]
MHQHQRMLFRYLLAGTAVAAVATGAFWASTRPAQAPLQAAADAPSGIAISGVVAANERALAAPGGHRRALPQLAVERELTAAEEALPAAMRPSAESLTPVTDLMPRVPPGADLDELPPIERELSPGQQANHERVMREKKAAYEAWERDAGLSPGQREACRQIMRELQWLQAQARAKYPEGLPDECQDLICYSELLGHQESLRERFLQVISIEQWEAFLGVFGSTTMVMAYLENYMFLY